MAQIELRNVSKTYANGVRAVCDLSLHVQDQELFVLLGPSGCGKTTTLRLIAGLESVSQGSIWLGGQEVTRWPPHRRRLAMLFQSPAVYPHLRARENLAFGQASLYNVFSWWSKKPCLRQQVEATARLLGIEGLLDRKPAELSGGERQRVALGRALLRHPAVFLLDEPLAHVDLMLRSQVRYELKALQRQRRATVIWVTHDHAEALALADRVAVLQAGLLLQVGTPAEVYERPADRNVARLVGQPTINLVPGHVITKEGEERLSTRFGDVPLPTGWHSWAQRCSGRSVILGVRPQDVKLQTEPSWLSLRVGFVEYGEGRAKVIVHNGQDALTILADMGQNLHSEELVPVAWDWGKVHVFDQTTGLRIETPRP
jgi:ABC-type sugar transport system ATPase subunit